MKFEDIKMGMKVTIMKDSNRGFYKIGEKATVNGIDSLFSTVDLMFIESHNEEREIFPYQGYFCKGAIPEDIEPTYKIGERSYATNKYIIVFKDEDSIQLNIDQDINRPNNPCDYEIIKKYILDNYGYKQYEIVELDNIKRFEI